MPANQYQQPSEKLLINPLAESIIFDSDQQRQPSRPVSNQDIMSYMRSLADEFKNTLSEALSTHTQSLMQSMQYQENELKEAASVQRPDLDLPVIRRDIICSFCEANPVYGSLFLILDNL